jgi:hypothetical protein
VVIGRIGGLVIFKAAPLAVFAVIYIKFPSEFWDNSQSLSLPTCESNTYAKNLDFSESGLYTGGWKYALLCGKT